MCGLFGSFGKSLFKKTNHAAFRSMQHRGPDDKYALSDEKYFTSAAVRLAFQDIERGRQPFEAGKNNNLVVSLNGEIYNYNDLKKEYSNYPQFMLTTDCDTEIIAPLYDLFGFDFINKLRGMYAISIWDKSTEKGILAVDYLSQKPIYYSIVNKNLYYASDLNTLTCILVSEGVTTKYQLKKEVNYPAFLDVIKYKSILNGDTVYNNIYRLKPGYVLEYNSDKTETLNIQLSKLNTYPTSINTGNSISSISESDLVEDIDYLLTQAVRRRIDPTKPQSLYLSGGLDSSLVCVICRKLFPEIKLHTFNLNYSTIDHKGKQLDKEFANLISKQINSIHHNICVDPSDLGDYLPDIISSFGEPFSAVPSMWFVAKEIKQYSKYSISGDGADELFGSYFTHRKASNSSSTHTHPSKLLSDYLSSFLDNTFSHSSFEARHDALLKSFHQSYGNYYLSEDLLNSQLLFESTYSFPYGVLTYVDRLSMTHSVEPRSPFLDQDLWEYVSKISGKWKIKDGNTKFILKKLAERYLPNELIYRPKEGFVFPLYAYIIKDQKSILSNIDLLFSDKTLASNLALNYRSIQDHLNEITHKKQDAFKSSQLIHSLNTLSIWMQG